MLRWSWADPPKLLLGFTHRSLARQGDLSGDAGCDGLVDVADAELGLLLADALADQSLLRQVLSSDSNRSRLADSGLAGGKERTLEVFDRSPSDQFRDYRPVHRSGRLAAGCGCRTTP